MMISMHASMRDRYNLFSNIGYSTLFLSSIILNAFVFADEQIFQIIRYNAELSSHIVGLSSILIFFSSLLLIIFDWKGKARNHELAKNKLYNLLEDVRNLLSIENLKIERIDDFEKNKVKVFNRLIPIPEKKFNRLKHAHYYKVAFSKYIDENHELPYLIVLIKFWFNSNTLIK